MLHVVYDNAQSAEVAGHKQHAYANAHVKGAGWFQSKDAFMAAVCDAFEKMYDEMKIG